MAEYDCVVIVPIYKKTLNEIEYLCLSNYRKKLSGLPFGFIAPMDIEEDYYTKKWDGLPVKKFATWCADSLDDYNRLLMTPEFYSGFLNYDYMLILQLDGWLIKGKEELKRFLQMGYDYMGDIIKGLFMERIILNYCDILLVKQFAGLVMEVSVFAE